MFGQHHHFISYSTVEAQEFAAKLHDLLEGGYPKISVWLDKRDLKPAIDWDTQISEAIRDCDSILFVMTLDSVTSPNCKDEWSMGLRYKKHIIPLLLKKCDAPFRLQNRQYIDFSQDFDTGLAKLREHLLWLASLEGELQRLKDQLADAERDLRRAIDGVETARIQDEMTDLRRAIARQEEIVRDPKKAEERTQQSIERGLERERQPEQPISGTRTSKFINPPPGIAPDYFQDRYVETKQVADFLRHESQRMITVVGRGGVGKTAMVCRLLKGFESGKLPDNLPTTTIDGIVYLSETGISKINVANLFNDLGKLLPKETAVELGRLYKNPETTTESKVRKLLAAFSVGRYVLLLDNFEDALDENRKIKDAELNETLKTFLSAPQHAIKVIITTRNVPRDLLMTHPERQRLPALELDSGLKSPYAENVLREMDWEGRLGLKNANEATLERACERVRGYPRALEALVAALAADRETTLESILKVAEKVPENVIQVLVGEAFNRLESKAQKVMQALAIYGRPVPEVAVDYLLQPFVAGINSAQILGRLVNLRLVLREAEVFYLHPVDKQYALSLLPNGENKDHTEVLASDFNKTALFHRGAAFFATIRRPRDEWKTLADLRPQLDEYDLLCDAQDWDMAASVLLEIEGNYLYLWGYYQKIIALHERLQGEINSPALKGKCLNNLGRAFADLGQLQKAISYYECALQFALESEVRQLEGNVLNDLGAAHRELGQLSKAIDYFERGLIIAHEIGNKKNEGIILGNLGMTYSKLGEFKKAIDYFEQGVIAAREIGNKSGEEVWLGCLSNTYRDLGELDKAIDYYQQTLQISPKSSDKAGKAIRLANTGFYLVYQEQWGKAMHCFHEGIAVADEISFPLIQNYGRLGLAQTYLYMNNLAMARKISEESNRYDVYQYNHSILTLLGVVSIRQGDVSAANTAFNQAIVKSDAILEQTAKYYDAIDAKGIALCGLALCTVNVAYIVQAKEAFWEARAITKAKGIIGHVLRLFDALAVADNNWMLKDVRAVAAGEDKLEYPNEME